MKNPLIVIFLLIWSLSGCSFLGFHSDPYGLEDGEEVEETAEDESFEEEEEEETADEEDFDDDEEMAEDESFEEEEEEGKSRGGFFSRIFSFSDSDDDEDIMDDDDEVSYVEGDEEGGMDEGDSQVDMEDYEEADDTTGAESYYAENKPQQPQQQQPARKLVSVKKIKSAPYRRSGFLVNAVYLVRSGDTIESVSQKIYGQDRTEDLYAINPHFRSRSLKTGDKVYYPSPQRPNDSSQLLVYYEDVGQTPSYHLLEEGQNIRAAARRLLGSSQSWKEIWATNPEIQSKVAAERTVQLRYWTGTETHTPPQQAAQEPEETFPEPEPPALAEPPEPASVEAAPDDVDDFPPVEDDPIPDDSSQSSAMGIIDTIKKNKLVGIGFIAFIALLLLITKRIINRVRNPNEEFDYTKTSIDDNKISI